MLGFATVLLVGAALGGLAVQRAVLLQRHDDAVNEMLEQERAELERLAAGRDPSTGEPFAGDVEAIFATFLARNVPGSGEAFITFVDGRPHSRTPAPIQLDEVPELVERWGDLEVGERGVIETDAGPVRFMAVPLASGGETTGVFVAVNFLQAERDAIHDDLRVQAMVVAAAVALATIVAWLTAGRLLRPLRTVTETAQAITEKGLDQRIAVETDDEVGELAKTFNQMLDRLETAFAGQRQFVDDAGHELRTPITIIMGQLELMGDEPEDRQRTLAVVNDELERMARIVEDLLVLAKAEQPDFIQREPVELSDFTTEMLVKARLLGDRAWVFEGSATGTVLADPQRLTQALLNLARNAVEHTAPDTVVGIGSARRAGSVVLWVRDEGPGIPVEDQARLFERFARGEGARRRSEGAGLGLAIVAAVAAGHGGSVGLDSAPGRGARFEIELPSGEPPPDGDQQAHTSPPPPEAAGGEDRTVVLPREPGDPVDRGEDGPTAVLPVIDPDATSELPTDEDRSP